MPVNFDNVLELRSWPNPPNAWRWLTALGIMVVASMLFCGAIKYPTEEDSRSLTPLILPISIWLMALMLRLLYFSFYSCSISLWNRERQEMILQKTRQGRRALQVLSAQFITGHATLNHGRYLPPLESTLKSERILTPRLSRDGIHTFPHSRIGDKTPPLHTPLNTVDLAFTTLAASLTGQLAQVPANQEVAILFESSCTLPAEHLWEMWQSAWQQQGIQQPLARLPGTGMAVIDEWLDRHIEKKSLLLVVAIQVAPETVKGSAEAAVALLLGNRLTQKVLKPIALLHRPEQTTLPTLAQGIEQSAYWVPLRHGEELGHLWLAATDRQSQSAVMARCGQSPLGGIRADNGLYPLDDLCGDAGAAAPWLALATASQAAASTSAMQLVISGVPMQESVWITHLSPVAPESA